MIEAALAGPGIVMLVGAADTGKTTMALQLANSALERGVRVGVIDCDVGQSEIGPPATVGLALPQAPAASAAEWRPAALAFVGSTSPPGRLLDLVVGARRLADEARRRHAELLIVDTSGLVEGALALRLKLAKFEALQPTLVLALARSRELEPVLRLIPAACRAHVITLSPSEQVRSKPPALRRARRAARFAEYLAEARPHVLDARRIVTTDGWLFTGQPLEPARLMAAARVLGRPVPYGEETAEGIRLVTQGSASLSLSGPELRELFGRRRVAVTPSFVFQNLLVGLLEEGGRLEEIGILEQVNYLSRSLRVLSPLRSEGALRVVRFGRLRLRLDGSEIGPVRPGDL